MRVRPNIVFVLVDSLNRASISPYQQEAAAATPNLEGFADQALRFNNAFVGSLPCMPARRDLFTGWKELLWRPWGPLETFEPRLPQILAGLGYTTSLVTDHYHYWEEHGNGYMQSFQSAELIRGHESDFWQPPPPEDEAVPPWVQQIERWRPGSGRRYFANVRDKESEEDFFAPQVFSSAADWLREHAKRQEPFFLQVESFDVHEPWHLPEPYRSEFGDREGDDSVTCWPPYQRADYLTAFMSVASEEDLEHIRSRYAGKVAMMDRWFGRLMEQLEQSGLLEDTVVIFTTDHGHDLGERGRFGKSFPNFDTHAHIPLLIAHPEMAERGITTEALTSAVDIFSTIIECAGGRVPEGRHGRSLMPVIHDPESSVRDLVIYGSFGQGICCTDGEWSLLKMPIEGMPLYSYSGLVFESLLADFELPVEHGNYIPGVQTPQWKTPVREVRHACLDATQLPAQVGELRDMLFHRASDPKQESNLWDADVEQRSRLLNMLVDEIHAEGAPPEQYARLGLG